VFREELLGGENLCKKNVTGKSVVYRADLKEERGDTKENLRQGSFWQKERKMSHPSDDPGTFLAPADAAD